MTTDRFCKLFTIYRSSEYTQWKQKRVAVANHFILLNIVLMPLIWTHYPRLKKSYQHLNNQIMLFAILPLLLLALALIWKKQ